MASSRNVSRIDWGVRAWSKSGTGKYRAGCWLSWMPTGTLLVLLNEIGPAAAFWGWKFELGTLTLMMSYSTATTGLKSR